MAATRSAGYRKNAFILCHDTADSPEGLSDDCLQLNIGESVLTLGSPEFEWRCIQAAKDSEEAVDMLTINAAIQLGINNEFGSIEKGKHADFAIFNENPLEAKTLDEFKKQKAVMTVIGGAVVYDKEEDDISQWHSMLTEQQD
jgi:N-acetylglucosamine-6-phosphate deacetylase